MQKRINGITHNEEEKIGLKTIHKTLISQIDKIKNFLFLFINFLLFKFIFLLFIYFIFQL